MKLSPKSFGLFTLLVVSIYVMRDGGISFTSPVSRSVFRRLYDYARPSSETCDGVTLTSTFTEAELKRAENLQKSINSLRKGNPLETVFKSGDIGGNIADYAMGLIAPVAVWAVMFVLSIILCICGCCNWCCMFGCCKNARCCKCCKPPRTANKKKVYMAITLLLMLALFSAGIAGAVFSGSISKGMKVSYCVILDMAENLVYGQQSTKWLGLKGITESLEDILSQFDSTVTGLTSSTATYSANLDSSYSSTKTAIDDFYTAYNTDAASKTVRRAEPSYSQATYKPAYNKNLGPATTSGTYLNPLRVELDAKYDALSNAQSLIDSAITELKSQQSSIHDALGSGISTANDVTTSMDDLIKSLNNAGKTVNNIVTIISKVILAIFIVYIVMGLLPIISMLLIHFLKIRFFSKVMHFSWCLMGFLAIIGFLICAIFYPISLVFTEVCQILTVAVESEAYFNSTLAPAFGSGQAGDLVFTCMFGSGAALDQLGVADSVSYFDTIFTQLDTVNSAIGLTASDPVPSVSVPYSEWLLKSTRDSLTVDGTETTDDLKTLLSYTKKSANSCTSISDTWLLSGTNCTDSSSQGTKYDKSSATFDEPSATCVGMDDWNTAGFSINTRYTTSQFPGSCSQVNSQNQVDYLRDYIDNFVDNRADVKTLFSTMYTDMSGTTTGHIHYEEGQFGHWAYESLQPLVTVKAQLLSIQDSLTGDANGVIPNTKCQFIGTDLRNLAAALCTGFITSLYQATVVLIIVSVFSFFGAICVMCTAKRINNSSDSEEKKSVAPDGYAYGNNQTKLS